ncbi:MAG: AMP-binding protein [Acidimicrobiales bacterium]|nr:AMP-binding protein [Acidimicrobiales bacterium]
MDRNLIHEYLRSASGDAPALIFGSQTLSFGELAERADRLAALVLEATEPGDRVAIVGHNSVDYVAALYGVPRAGRILTLLNQRLTPAEMAAVVADCGAAMVLGDAPFVDDLEPVLPPGVQTVARFAPGWLDAMAPIDEAAAPAGGGDTDTAWLIYTSGTTGPAKGAMLTHASLGAAVEVTAAGRPVEPEDVYLFPFPLCHVAAYNVLVQHAHGRPVVLLERFDAAEVLRLVPAHRVTTMSLAPTMMAMLLDHPDFSRVAMASVRVVGYGASGPPEALLRRFLTETDAGLAQGYGMTELSGNAVFLTPDDHRRGLADRPELLQAAGRPAPGVSLRIVDAGKQTTLVDVAPGTVGEIAIRSRQLLSAYWNRPDATAAALVEGWLRTGDMGRVDEEGYLYVVDRLKDIIVTGGENVSSREVEQVLFDHPGVAEAAVVAVPDPEWGEAICAVIVRRPGRGGEADVSPAEIVQHCRDRLAGFKKPRHVLFRDDLPTNASGKVLKPDVRHWAHQQLR